MWQWNRQLAPQWELTKHHFGQIFFLYSYEEEYMSSLISSNEIKARHFHSPRHFIDNLCTINGGGEFERSICEIYPKELEHKVENQGDHATFLIKETLFPFLIVRMLHIESNILQNIFYSAIRDEFLRMPQGLCT